MHMKGIFLEANTKYVAQEYHGRCCIYEESLKLEKQVYSEATHLSVNAVL